MLPSQIDPVKYPLSNQYPVKLIPSQIDPQSNWSPVNPQVDPQSTSSQIKFHWQDRQWIHQAHSDSHAASLSWEGELRGCVMTLRLTCCITELRGCVKRVCWEGVLWHYDSHAASLSWEGGLRGCVIRVCWEGALLGCVLRGCVIRVCWEGALLGCVERVRCVTDRQKTEGIRKANLIYGRALHPNERRSPSLNRTLQWFLGEDGKMGCVNRISW